jgi:hypothetical protein
VTPRVTNNQGSVKHVPANMKKLIAIRIPIGKIEKFKFCHHGPDDRIQYFWRFYEDGLVLAPKTKFHPHDMFYKHANLQKFMMSLSICFGGPHKTIRTQIPDLGKFLELA